MSDSALVFDNGSALFKAGFAGEDGNRISFPTVISSSSLNHNELVGDDAVTSREEFSCPIVNRKIVNMDLMQKIWNYTFLTEFGLPSDERPVLLTEASLNDRATKELTGQIMFEKFNIPAMYLASQSVLALYCAGKTSGAVIDIGDTVTDVVSIWEGYAFPHAIKRLEIGGRHLTGYMKKLLSERGICFARHDEHDIITDIKQKTCSVALDFNEAMKKPAEEISKIYELPDGSTISIGNESIQVAEALFQPSVLGVNSVGIDKLTYESIDKLDTHERMEIFAHILVAGGTSMIEGLVDRVKKEIAPLNRRTAVAKPDSCNISSWVGGSILASLSTFQGMWISKIEYEETGPAIICRKCF